MGLSVDYGTRHTLTQTFDTSATDGGLQRSSFDSGVQLDGTTTPAVTEGGFAQKAMTTGAATLDLTALVDARSRTFSLSGLKPRTMKILALATNAGAVTISKGASQGYGGLGASFSLTLQPGQEVTLYLGSAAVAVSGTVKNLDLAGTGTDGVQLSISAGA